MLDTITTIVARHMMWVVFLSTFECFEGEVVWGPCVVKLERDWTTDVLGCGTYDDTCVMGNGWMEEGKTLL